MPDRRGSGRGMARSCNRIEHFHAGLERPADSSPRSVSSNGLAEQLSRRRLHEVAIVDPPVVEVALAPALVLVDRLLGGPFRRSGWGSTIGAAAPRRRRPPHATDARRPYEGAKQRRSTVQTITARSTSTASMTATTSSDELRVAFGDEIGRPVGRPFPRPSNVATCQCRDRNGSAPSSAASRRSTTSEGAGSSASPMYSVPSRRGRCCADEPRLVRIPRTRLLIGWAIRTAEGKVSAR